MTAPPSDGECENAPHHQHKFSSLSSPQHSYHEGILKWLSETSSPSRDVRKRQLALSEADPNIMASRPKSPTKKRKLAQIEGDDVGDLDATPRPGSYRLKIPRSLSDNSLPSAPSSPTKSNASQRSTSPVKRMGDLVLRPHPIVMQSFADPEAVRPRGLTEMLATVQQFSRGLAVVSESIRVNILEKSTSDISFQEIDDYVFSKDSARDNLGPSPSPNAVAKLVRLARECEKHGHSEPHWNCRVHSPILDLALDNDMYRKEVDFLNCTTAQIEPKTLIHPDHSGKLGESKKIDFAIYVEPDKAAIEAMRAMAARHPYETPTVNHTWYTPLLFRPISVNIETKRMGESWDTAIVQSGVWIAAQFAKLDKLMADFNGDLDDMSFLPLIIVQGHDWHFLAASRGDHGETYIWSKVTFGSTSSPLGVYQIVATIQYLARWTHEVYRPWFLTNALGMNLSEKTSAPTRQTPS